MEAAGPAEPDQKCNIQLDVLIRFHWRMLRFHSLSLTFSLPFHLFVFFFLSRITSIPSSLLSTSTTVVYNIILYASNCIKSTHAQIIELCGTNRRNAVIKIELYFLLAVVRIFIGQIWGFSFENIERRYVSILKRFTRMAFISNRAKTDYARRYWYWERGKWRERRGKRRRASSCIDALVNLR